MERGSKKREAGEMRETDRQIDTCTESVSEIIHRFSTYESDCTDTDASKATGS